MIGIIDGLSSKSKGPCLTSSWFKVFLAWPRLTTLEALSFSVCFANIHQNTLTHKGAQLVQVYDQRGWLRRGFGHRSVICGPVVLFWFPRTSFSVLNFLEHVISLNESIDSCIKVCQHSQLSFFDKLNNVVF